MTRTLRRFQDADALEVTRWVSTGEEARRWGGRAVHWPLDQSVFRTWHADRDVWPYVLREHEDSIAYGELWVDDGEREVELARIIVRPAWRGRGVGRLLVSRLLEQAAGARCRAAFVRVVQENAAALACYRAAGFRPVSAEEQDRFNEGQPVDYLWLRRAL